MIMSGLQQWLKSIGIDAEKMEKVAVDIVGAMNATVERLTAVETKINYHTHLLERIYQMNGGLQQVGQDRSNNDQPEVKN